MNQEPQRKDPNHPFSVEEIQAKAHQIWETRVITHNPDDDWNEAIRVLARERDRRSPVRLLGKGLKALWKWSGLEDKKFWDLAQLLLVPLLLVSAAFYLPDQAKKKEQDLAADKENQEILATYLEQMAVSLKDGLRESELDSVTFIVAQVRTATVLQSLSQDAQRQHFVIQFLNTVQPSSSDIKEKKSAWKGLLYRARMYKANLGNSDFSGAPFNGIILTSSYLRGANFRYATLSNANLDYANASHSDLSHANLGMASLERIDLVNTNLTGANFTNADLTGADLTGADLTGADLIGTNLTRANLIRAKGLTWQHVYSAKLCQTQLPPGITVTPDRDCNDLGIAPN